MNIYVPDELSECTDEKLREVERQVDALRVRVLLEMGSRVKNAAGDERAAKMAKRPQWAQTAGKLLPGFKGRVFAAALVVAIVMFKSMIGPLHALWEQYERQAEMLEMGH